MAGIASAWFRYGGSARALRLEEAKAPAIGLTAFLLHGWYSDDLYKFLFVRPFVKFSRILWEKVDARIIDKSIDRFAALLGRGGVLLGSWTCGRVSLYLLSLAAGAAQILGYMAWSVMM